MKTSTDKLSRAIRHLATTSPSKTEMNEIIHRLNVSYSDRAYHGLSHIDFCLKQMSKIRGMETEMKNVLIIAIWFHDLIQDTQRPMEALFNTVDLMREILNPYLHFKHISLIQECICYTSHFNIRKAKGDASYLGSYMSDIDLTILGQSHDKYSTYTVQLEIEVTERFNVENFLANRINFLKSMLQWTRIYVTPEFGKLYEWQARTNMLNEIDMIKKRLKTQ